jgi:penicillin amidase
MREPHELPRVVDPPSGVVAVANNLTPSHAGVGDNGFSARRAHRAVELLTRSPALAEADLLRLQRDDDARFYDFYRDLVCRLAAESHRPLSATQREALEVIKTWDGRAGVDAVGLGLLVLLRENLRESLLAAVLAPCRERDPAFRYVWYDHEHVVRTLLTTDPAVLPRPHSSRADLVLSHLELSAAMLRAAAGDRPLATVTWGQVNRTAARHPLTTVVPDLAPLLDPPDAPMPGCAESIHLAHPGFGPAVRFAVSPGHPADALLNLAGGQSGDPRSPHYGDQWPAWRAGDAVAMAAGPAVTEVVLPATGGAAGGTR